MINAILIHGRKGVGKDMLGAHLHFGFGYIKTALADPLRWLLEESNPMMTIEDTEVRLVEVLNACESWDEAKRLHPEVRDLLKSFGQGARNAFGEDFWVERYRQRMDEIRLAYPGTNRYVVTDIRYENELRLLKEYYGKNTRTIKIIRPGCGADGHPSEEGLPDAMFDMVLENEGTPHDLFAKMNLVHAVWNVPAEIAA